MRPLSSSGLANYSCVAGEEMFLYFFFFVFRVSLIIISYGKTYFFACYLSFTTAACEAVWEEINSM